MHFRGCVMSSYSWVTPILDQISRKISMISDIWNDMGLEGNNLKLRIDSLSSYLFSMLDEMYNEEILAKQTVIDSIRRLKVKIKELESELGMASYVPDSSSLVMTEKLLYDHFKSLSERSSAVLQRYNSLKQEEEKLCTRLEEIQVPVTFTHVPNSEQLEILKENIDHLTIEKRSRSLRLSKLIQEVKNLRAVLQRETSDDEELIALITAPNAMENLPLSNSFLNRVARLRNSLAQELVQMDSECQVLIEEIVNLEGRLSISSTDVVNTKQPVSSNFVHYLRNELKRLKELRLKNLRTIILKCQTELVDWWENCLVGGDARDSRLTSANQEMNESLLTSLELEIAKWKAFYSRNEPFFKAVESWQCVLSRLRMSEQKMKDPSVLKNRGGILLVIDKEIKQLRRDLSRQYSILRELSCSFPDVKVHGFSVLDYLDNAEQQYNVLGKENQVAQNMSGRDFSVSYMKTGISAKRTLNANKLQLRTPPSSKKRCIGPSNSTVTEFGSKFNLNTCLSQNLTCSSMISLTGSGSANTLSTAHTPITKVKVSVKTPVAFKVPSVSSISSSQKKTILSTPKPRRSGRLNGKKMCSTSRVPQRSPRSVNHSGTSVSNQIKRTARWT